MDKEGEMCNSLYGIIKILNKIKDKHVIVIGDILIDEYINGTVSRVSTGIQIPIISEDVIEYRLGGAANVAANIAGLCDNTILIGRYANDEAGKIVENICENLGIKLYRYLSQKTTVKKRIYVDNQQVLRIDSDAFTEPICAGIDNILLENKVDTIVIADYLYGVVSQKLIDRITDFCLKKNIQLLIDSRELNKFNLDSRVIIVANQMEWEKWNGANKQKHTYITMGDKGIKYISETGQIQVPCETKRQVNVSGAGDTVLAIISMFYGENIEIKDMLNIANLAGQISVTNKSTYALRKGDLVKSLYNQFIYKNSNNKIMNISVARDIINIWRNEGKKIVFTNGCYDLLHLGHIESFKYSKKFGDKLIVGINSDESVKKIKGDERPINNLENRSKMLASLCMIDMVIPFNDDTAVSIIKQIEPDIYVKGAEYKKQNMQELKYVKRVEFAPMIDEISTTHIINKISKAVEMNE